MAQHRITTRLAERCVQLYAELEKGAEHDESGQFVYRGSLTTAFDRCGFSRTYYTRLYGILYDFSYMTLVERGRFGVGSVVVLHRPPTVAEILEIGLTYGPHSDKLIRDGRLTQLERQVGELNIPSLMVVIDRKLQSLDKRITRLERNATSTNSTEGEQTDGIRDYRG